MTCSQLLPADLDFVNVREWETEVMNPMLKTISDKLGLDGWKIGASLYKMLLYEPGCFFRRARVVLSHCVRMVPASMSTHLFCRALSCGAPRAGHKDNVRIDNMWGTLVIQLPSEYTGASLSVYSPSTPNEHTVFAFGGGVETGSSSTTRRVCAASEDMNPQRGPAPRALMSRGRSCAERVPHA